MIGDLTPLESAQDPLYVRFGLTSAAFGLVFFWPLLGVQARGRPACFDDRASCLLRHDH